MQFHRELKIEATNPDVEISEIVTAITDSLSGNWIRDEEIEKEMPGSGRRALVCFEKTGQASESARLWLAPDPDGAKCLYVSNIVPTKVRQLTVDQYNSILADFYEQVKRPLSQISGCSATLTGQDKQATDFMSPELFQRLKTFSSAANKSTGSAHPADQERWIEFIISAVDEKRLGEGVLKRILIEELHWSPEMAVDLIEEFSFGRAVAKAAFQQRG